MSQTVHFQGNPVTVANSIPQAGSKAQTFTLVAKDLSTSPSVSLRVNAKC